MVKDDHLTRPATSFASGDPPGVFLVSFREFSQFVPRFGVRTVPSLKRVANSGALLDPSRPPSRSKVFLSGIPHLRRTPVIPTWPEIEDLSEELVTRLFYESDYRIDRFLDELREATNPLFDEGQQG